MEKNDSKHTSECIYIFAISAVAAQERNGFGRHTKVPNRHTIILTPFDEETRPTHPHKDPPGPTLRQAGSGFAASEP